MRQNAKDIYYANSIEKIGFTESELSRMKIAFMETLNDINPALIRLGVHGVGPNSELVDHGYTLAQIGPLNNPSWVIYSTELRFDYVSDVWNRRNFYVISKETSDGRKIVFNKAHLRVNNLEEDMSYYINLDSKFDEGPYEVFSEYIQ